MFADRGGQAFGTVQYERRPEPLGLPVQLGPRPVVLAGREGLLAELDARLAELDAADAGEQAGPRVVVVCGLGGAGKTSVAVEYAYRHVTEVGVCCTDARSVTSTAALPHRVFSFISVVGGGTFPSSGIRQNRRQVIESLTSAHRLSKPSRYRNFKNIIRR